MARDEKGDVALKKCDRLLAIFGTSIGATVSSQVLRTFILVSRNDGRGPAELADMAGASKGTMSRHLLDLSESLRSGEPGYGLLQRYQDPTNLRSVMYTLTNKGKQLKNQIIDLLEE